MIMGQGDQCPTKCSDCPLPQSWWLTKSKICERFRWEWSEHSLVCLQFKVASDWLMYEEGVACSFSCFLHSSTSHSVTVTMEYTDTVTSAGLWHRDSLCCPSPAHRKCSKWTSTSWQGNIKRWGFLCWTVPKMVDYRFNKVHSGCIVNWLLTFFCYQTWMCFFHIPDVFRWTSSVFVRVMDVVDSDERLYIDKGAHI